MLMLTSLSLKIKGALTWSSTICFRRSVGLADVWSDQPVGDVISYVEGREQITLHHTASMKLTQVSV